MSNFNLIEDVYRCRQRCPRLDKEMQTTHYVYPQKCKKRLFYGTTVVKLHLAFRVMIFGLRKLSLIVNRLLDCLAVECWLRVREVPGSIPSQGPRHTKDVIKMVPAMPLFSTEHSKGKILALFTSN